MGAWGWGRKGCVGWAVGCSVRRVGGSGVVRYGVVRDGCGRSVQTLVAGSAGESPSSGGSSCVRRWSSSVRRWMSRACGGSVSVSKPEGPTHHPTHPSGSLRRRPGHIGSPLRLRTSARIRKPACLPAGQTGEVSAPKLPTLCPKHPHRGSHVAPAILGALCIPSNIYLHHHTLSHDTHFCILVITLPPTPP